MVPIDQPSSTALTIGQVQEGVDYALLISTCSGAWRYLIGDTVRFTDKQRWRSLSPGASSISLAFVENICQLTI